MDVTHIELTGPDKSIIRIGDDIFGGCEKNTPQIHIENMWKKCPKLCVVVDSRDAQEIFYLRLVKGVPTFVREQFQE